MINYIYNYYNIDTLKFVSLSLIQLFVLYIIFYEYNIFNISNNFPKLVIFIILLIQFIYFINYYFFKVHYNNNNFFEFNETEIKQFSNYFLYLKNLLLIFSLPVSIVLLTYFLLYVFRNFAYVIYIIETIVTYSIYIAIIYFIYNSKDVIIDFINNNISINSLLLTINNKTNQFTLLAIVMLVIINISLPYLFRKITSYNGTILIDKPVYLNNKYIRGNEDILYKIKPRNYNYSISLWFWLNPQPSNTSYAYQKYTNILTFNKKPAIEYNGSNNTLRILFDNTDKEHTIFSSKNVLYQKWNNLVINYTEGNVDVFLNSELMGSKPNISPFYNYTFIEIGENKGLHGGISNVIYFQEPLTLTKIKLNYNLFSKLNEPYI